MRLVHTLHTETGELIAEAIVVSKYSIDLGFDGLHRFFGKEQCSAVIRALRQIHSDVACCVLHVKETGNFGFLNQPTNPGPYAMDIFNSLHSHVDKAALYPLLMIAPIANDIPEDGIMMYRTVEKLSDLLETPKPNEVVLFREDQSELLTCLGEYPSLFGVDVIVVSGIPGTTYSPEFESKVWDKPKLAYHSVVNDLIEAQRRAQDMSADVRDASVYAKEQGTFVRKNGGVKVFTDFEGAGGDGAATDEDVD